MLHLNFKYLDHFELFQFESLKKAKFTPRSQEAMLFDHSEADRRPKWLADNMND